MHAKRLTAPRVLKIPKRVSRFIVKPSPGPHPAERSIPLLVLVRDVLGYARNAREAKRIIKAGKVLVDGRVRKDHKYPVGLMDVVTIPEAEVSKVVVMDTRGRLVLRDIPPEQAGTKLCRIENKTVVKGGHIQLNMHDGRNLLVRVKNPEKPEEDVYTTGDSVLVDLSSGAAVGHIKYEPGSLGYVIGGRHTGEVARIEEIRKVRGCQPNVVVLSKGSGRFETIEDYVFVIGEQEPVLRGVFEE